MSNPVSPQNTSPDRSGQIPAGRAAAVLSTLDTIAAVIDGREYITSRAGQVRDAVQNAYQGLREQAVTGDDVLCTPPLETLDRIAGILGSPDGIVSRMNRIRAVLRERGYDINPAEMS
jgi:hypothetical protein